MTMPELLDALRAERDRCQKMLDAIDAVFAVYEPVPAESVPPPAAPVAAASPSPKSTKPPAGKPAPKQFTHAGWAAKYEERLKAQGFKPTRRMKEGGWEVSVQ